MRPYEGQGSEGASALASRPAAGGDSGRAARFAAACQDSGPSAAIAASSVAWTETDTNTAQGWAGVPPV